MILLHFILIPLNSPLKLFITGKDFTVEFIIEPLFSQQLSSNSRHHPYGRISGIINITSITVILITHKHLRGKFGQHRNGPFHARKREWCPPSASWGSNLHDISAILPQHREALNICLWGKWACSLHILVLYLHDSSYKK